MHYAPKATTADQQGNKGNGSSDDDKPHVVEQKHSGPAQSCRYWQDDTLRPILLPAIERMVLDNLITDYLESCYLVGNRYFSPWLNAFNDQPSEFITYICEL